MKVGNRKMIKQQASFEIAVIVRNDKAGKDKGCLL